MSDPLVLRDVHRTYRGEADAVSVLRGVDLTLRAGEIVALVAPSGVGKSTLLHIAGLLERPDGGEVIVDGISCGKLGDDARTRLRRIHLGFVYQFHHLLPEFSALENVMLPQLIAGLSRAEARARARQLLAMVGLGAREQHRPARLSGGEQQRVAIVRAIANAPRLLLADEPTGNLDHDTAHAVFAQLKAIVRQTGLAALVATHNQELAGGMDRVLALSAGQVVKAA